MCDLLSVGEVAKIYSAPPGKSAGLWIDWVPIFRGRASTGSFPDLYCRR